MSCPQPPALHSFGPYPRPEINTVSIADGAVRLHVADIPGCPAVCSFKAVWPGGLFDLATEEDMIAAPQAAQMATMGSALLDYDAMSDLLDFNSATVSSDMAYHTHSVAVSACNTRISQVVPAVMEALAAPKFMPDVHRSLLAQKVEAVRVQQSTPSYHANTLANRMLMGADHPGAFVPEVNALESLDPRAVAQWQTRLWARSGIEAFLTGRVTDNVREVFLQSLEDFLTKTANSIAPLPRRLALFEAQKPGIYKTVLPGTLQSALVMGVPTPGRHHHDYQTLRLTVMALGGYFGSRLMSTVREKHGLTYGISAALLGFQEGSFARIASQQDVSQTDTVIDLVREEIRRLASDPPVGQELERLRTYSLSSIASDMESPADLLEHISVPLILGLDADYFAKQWEAARALTSEQISTLAARYLDPDKLRIAIVADS